MALIFVKAFCRYRGHTLTRYPLVSASEALNVEESVGSVRTGLEPAVYLEIVWMSSCVTQNNVRVVAQCP